MSGPENGTFLGEEKVPYFDDIFVILGARFFGVPEKFFVPEGPKNVDFGHFWPFWTILGTPPKSGIFRKNALRFHSNGGPKKVALPPF